MAGEGVKGHARRGDIVQDNKPQTNGQRSLPSPVGIASVPPVPKRLHENTEQSIRTQAASLSKVREDGYAGTDPNNANANGPLSRNSVCLCQPEPKIPRPRNAFILFRQHHHAAIIAQHPGLSNPDISKIIGERWRNIPQPERHQWKTLAEEEKLRHHQQYPEYKYQPRRNGKKGFAQLSSSATNPEEFPRCPKCGGRSLVVPRTPSPSLTPHPVTPSIPSSPFSLSSGSSGASSSPRTLPSMNTPIPGGPSAGNRFRRPEVPIPSMGALPLGSLREQPDEEALTPLTPETKRRRFNSNPPTPNNSGPITRSIANRMEGTTTRTPYPMDPPPRPRGGAIADPTTPPITSLPPLKTTTSDSVTAMVMTIPFINKIKVISRISPPLSSPSSLSPPFQIRGAIIAVDGNEPSTTDKLFRWLEETLRKSGEYAVKSFEAPLNRFERYGSLKAQDQLGPGDNQYFVEYLGEIVEWHRRSEEIVRHATHVPEEKEEKEKDSPSQQQLPDPQQQQQQTPPQRHPISLIPHYILTRSNTAASHIPINDRYAPIDHWQWMATLWRGCVGPDITIYAKDDCTPDEMASWGAVEMRTDAGAVIVRRLKSEPVWPDRALRRLGFEVGEWVRGGEGWGGPK
ncbi:MAG: hypothetical protein M1840_004767 [Geoglossum simile]|nr:MAG: hypothetical protein M1840_004767 [Geoglossum simile]